MNPDKTSDSFIKRMQGLEIALIDLKSKVNVELHTENVPSMISSRLELLGGLISDLKNPKTTSTSRQRSKKKYKGVLGRQTPVGIKFKGKYQAVDSLLDELKKIREDSAHGDFEITVDEDYLFALVMTATIVLHDLFLSITGRYIIMPIVQLYREFVYDFRDILKKEGIPTFKGDLQKIVDEAMATTINSLRVKILTHGKTEYVKGESYEESKQ